MSNHTGEPRSLGERLRHVRSQSGLSLAVVAERAALSTSFLWEVEHDRTGISAERLSRVADVLGASLDHLLRGQHYPGMPERQQVEIPRELGEVAEELQLTYGQTLALLEVEGHLAARRRHRRHMSKQDWHQLHQGVQPFLEPAP